MFYNQVKWLEIRAILSNLVPRPPEPIPVPLSFLPSFLFLSLSSFEAHQAYLIPGHVRLKRRGKVTRDPRSPVYDAPSP